MQSIKKNLKTYAMSLLLIIVSCKRVAVMVTHCKKMIENKNCKLLIR